MSTERNLLVGRAVARHNFSKIQYQEALALWLEQPNDKLLYEWQEHFSSLERQAFQQVLLAMRCQ